MKRALVLLVLAYGAICAFLYFTQESVLFYPGPNDARLRVQYQPNRVEIVTPGATIEGWWVENPNATNDLVALYFGGNGEDVLYSAGTVPRLTVRRMLVTNYRGYGESTGKPSEEAIFQDALAIYDFALSLGVRAEQIVVAGRSLGSGVASMLAGRRAVRAAILITPFDSVAAVAGERYPYVPVGVLLKHPFRSVEWARTARVPALLLAGENDTSVSPAHSRKLAEAWAGEVQFHVLPGVGHNDIEQNPNYYRLMSAFLGKVSGSR